MPIHSSSSALMIRRAFPPYAILSHTWGNDKVTFENANCCRLQNLRSCGAWKMPKTCERTCLSLMEKAPRQIIVRLHEEIIKDNNDQSLFAWTHPEGDDRKPNTLKSMGFSVCESPCEFPPWKFVHVSAQFYDLCTDKQWGQGHGTGPGMGAGS